MQTILLFKIYLHKKWQYIDDITYNVVNYQVKFIGKEFALNN